MRRFAILLFFSLLLFAGAVNAQRFKGEVIAGFNISQVDGDEVYGYSKFGANTGLGVMLPFSFKKNGERNWAVSMEMLWHQKGSYKRWYLDSTNSNSTTSGRRMPTMRSSRINALMPSMSSTR